VQPNIVAIAKVLFDSSKEAASFGTINSTYNFSIHSFIQDLVDAGQYCPLTLFSAENTECLHQEGHSLKCCKIHINGVSHHLLDLSQFKSELNLDTLTWQEAYWCYLTWIANVGNQASLKHWTNHFLHLSKDEAVHKNFRAILKFNIETCQNYVLHPHQHNQAEWEARLQCKKYSTLQDAFFSDRSFPDHQSTLHANCFDPYDHNSATK
jgi:hypothetical protein